MWMTKHDDEVRRLTARNRTIYSIADETGLTYGQVWTIQKRLGLEINREGGNPWHHSEDVKLRIFWTMGYSASVIANNFPDRTRNAVIGRAHRLNLPSRKSPIKR